MNTIVIAQHNGTDILPATLNTVTAAQSFDGNCDLVILGHQLETVLEKAKQIAGVNTLLTMEDPRLAKPVAEDLCMALTTIVKDYDVVLAPANTFGKNFMPRLAAQLGKNAYADVIDIQSNDTFVRPIFAGNVLQTVKVLDNQKILTIRPTAFEAASLEHGKATEVKVLSESLGESINHFESAKMSESLRPELSNAKIVVSGGRGLQSQDKFQLVEQLADKLGAAVGASRAAVDAGFVANDYQVGQTGKVVAPELYIALGISGAIQHLAGMKDSKIIVAINKDPEAPIFQVANYGLVGDLFELVPELIEKL